jgi:hypothetical protein
MPHAVEKLCTLSVVIYSNSQKEKEAKRKRSGRRRLSSSLRTTTITTTLNQVSRGPNNWGPYAKWDCTAKLACKGGKYRIIKREWQSAEYPGLLGGGIIECATKKNP